MQSRYNCILFGFHHRFPFSRDTAVRVTCTIDKFSNYGIEGGDEKRTRRDNIDTYAINFQMKRKTESVKFDRLRDEHEIDDGYLLL